jgi:hypothetical protein
MEKLASQVLFGRTKSKVDKFADNTAKDLKVCMISTVLYVCLQWAVLSQRGEHFPSFDDRFSASVSLVCLARLKCRCACFDHIDGIDCAEHGEERWKGVHFFR